MTLPVASPPSEKISTRVRARRRFALLAFLLLLGVLGGDWKKSDADVNGEFGYLVALAEFIPPRAARTAAAGWGGDGYVLYENKSTGAVLLEQFTTWDSENDAREFFEAYAARSEKRYVVAKPAYINERHRIYETDEGLVSIEIRGKDVLMLEGANDREQLAKLSDRSWQSRKK